MVNQRQAEHWTESLRHRLILNFKAVGEWTSTDSITAHALGEDS